MNGKDALVCVLSNLETKRGFPYFLQGSLSDEDAYPDSFFTFWNSETEDASFYDNEEHSAVWSLELYFYSVDPALVNSIFTEIRPDLKAAGFIIGSRGFDVLSDEPTHTGRGIALTYIERG